ncbi:putative RNA 3'-terminal phosphate cyclase [Helianthus annuus]|nr:putative RNA 3'-terminal phosphate cyclase [Helianthus annuus]KAJ0683816.1 putative RNA 3'-terminal phosphate cyclase [Helianthus annuus]KAJ0687779.1 putative RNA 3'-terminal phosphate cyclase [Helianthus annuus]
MTGSEFWWTKLKYKPGIVMGGRYLEHDCGLSRSIGYFLEPLFVLGLFGKKPLSIKLKGTLLPSFFRICSSFCRYSITPNVFN